MIPKGITCLFLLVVGMIVAMIIGAGFVIGGLTG